MDEYETEEHRGLRERAIGRMAELAPGDDGFIRVNLEHAADRALHATHDLVRPRRWRRMVLIGALVAGLAAAALVILRRRKGDGGAGHESEELDHALEDSFPTSDPPSATSASIV